MICVIGGVSGHISYKNVQNVGKREKIWVNKKVYLQPYFDKIEGKLLEPFFHKATKSN